MLVFNRFIISAIDTRRHMDYISNYMFVKTKIESISMLHGNTDNWFQCGAYRCHAYNLA